jgi:hypothetical protein
MTLVLSPLLISSFACGNGSHGDGENDAGADVNFNIDVELIDAIPTVAAVEWSVDRDKLDEAHISFGPDTEYGMQAPVDLSALPPYKTLLLGMKPGREYHFEIVAMTGQETLASGDVTLQTGYAPNSLPTVFLEVFDQERVETGFIVTANYVAPPSVVIFDSDGEYVWWHTVEDDNYNISRAHMSVDGACMLYWATNVLNNIDQKLYRVGMDGQELEGTPLPSGHHDFVPLPDGSIGYIEFDVRDVEGVDVSGDRIMELGPDGAITEIYSLWNDFDYTGWVDGIGDPVDWSHSNAIDYHEEDDTYYLSVLHFDGILKIDRKSGQLIWVLGGQYSDFTDSAGNGQLWNLQHQFQVLDESVVLFSNGLPEDMSSKALEVAVDETNKKMNLMWSYVPDPALTSFTFGDVQRLPRGNTMVTFSNSGQIDEVAPDGTVVRRISLGLKGALGYAAWTDTLYPTQQPKN